MKKVFCFCFMVFFLCNGISFGKTVNQGTFSLSGSTGLEFSDSTTEYDRRGVEDTDETEINLEADFHYFFQPNMGIGLIYLYQSSEEDSGGEEFDSSLWMIGPAFEIQLEMNQQTNAFFQIAIGLASGEAELSDDDDSIDADIEGSMWQIGAGIKHFFNNHVALNASLIYESSEMEYDYGIYTSDVDITSTALKVGFSVYF